MKNPMNAQKGFTLIELIIVIVILGILAVTAAPRFIDLQSDAKASTLSGVKAALQGSSQLVFAKAAINGQLDGTAAAPESVPLSATVNVDTVFGYPDAQSVASVADVTDFLDLDANDFTILNATAAEVFVIALGSGVADVAAANNCYLQYTNSTGANLSPTLLIVDTGC